MDLIKLFQSGSNSFFTFILSIFDYFFSLPFYCLLLSFLFLFVCKKIAIRLSVPFSLSFLFGGIFLAQVSGVKFPSQINSNLFTNKPSYLFGSFPNTDIMYLSGTSFYKTKPLNKKQNILIYSFICLCTLFGVISKIYFAKAYLIDIIVGLIFGYLIYFFSFKFIKINSKILLYFLFLPILLTFIYFDYWKLPYEYSNLFAISGFMTSLILFSFLEKKYIKYEIKYNLILDCFKIFLFLIVAILFYIFTNVLLVNYSIFAFISYFLFGFVTFFCLPILYKFLQKYFYTFNKKTTEKVIFSKIAVGENNTKKVALKISKLLNKGDVVLLQGDLGAGKSFITREILKCFNVLDKVTSPTFTLVNEYSSNLGHFYHFDMYRIEDEDEVKNIGFEDIIEDNDSIKFIEWSENIPNYIPKHYKKITLIKMTKKIRNIIFEEF